MSRLPAPGGDDGKWGNILNDFLLQAHTTDGTLLPADSNTIGGITLAGDLSGTAANPVVSGLADKADDADVVHLAGNETITGAKSFSNELSVPNVAVGGVTGALAGTRFVGATATGAPVSGTFVVGDIVIDRSNGCMWICSIAGTPGTWTRIGSPGIELGYAESMTAFATTSTSFVDVPGVTTTVTTGTRPVLITAWSGYVNNDTAGKGTAFSILEDGINVGAADFVSASASQLTSLTARARRNPTPGSHVYKLQIRGNGGTVTTNFFGADRTAIHVVEV